MFKIGDFSRLSLVTVKTLRYYDEMGLLKPAQVDDVTGYRYYTADQLPRLNRILALKDLGFTLEQIAPALAQGLSSEQLRGMLRLKQAEIEQKMQEERALLGRVEARLRQIEKEGKMSHYEVVLKTVAPIKVAGIRQIAPNPPYVGCLLTEIFTYLGEKGFKPAGPCGALWHDGEYKESDVDMEAYVPVGENAVGNDRIRVYELPAVETMASTIHHGSYKTLCQAYTAFLTWIESNGYQPVAAGREIYLHNSGDGAQDDEGCVTELQFPVAKV